MLQHDALCIQHGDHDEGESKHTLFLPTATQYGSVHWRFSDGRPTRSRYWNMQFRRTNIRRLRCLGEQGMALWWKHLSPTNVAHVQIPASTPYVGWVCCLFSSLLREVFLRVLRFSPLLRNQHFQIPIRPGSGRRRTAWRMCYFFKSLFIIYLTLPRSM